MKSLNNNQKKDNTNNNRAFFRSLFSFTYKELTYTHTTLFIDLILSNRAEKATLAHYCPTLSVTTSLCLAFVLPNLHFKQCVDMVQSIQWHLIYVCVCVSVCERKRNRDNVV